MTSHCTWCRTAVRRTPRSSIGCDDSTAISWSTSGASPIVKSPVPAPSSSTVRGRDPSSDSTMMKLSGGYGGRCRYAAATSSSPNWAAYSGARCRGFTPMSSGMRSIICEAERRHSPEDILHGQIARQRTVQGMPGSRNGDSLHEHPGVEQPEIVDPADELLQVGELGRKPHHGAERDDVEIDRRLIDWPGADPSLERVLDAVVAFAVTDEQSEMAAQLQQQIQQSRGIRTSVEEVILLGRDGGQVRLHVVVRLGIAHVV